MSMVWPDAIYRKTAIEEYGGNKLIECLPPIMSVEEFIAATTSYPNFSPEERALPSHYRLHLIKRLETLLIPTSEMVAAHNTLDVELRQSYVARDPRKVASRMAMYGLPTIGKVSHDAVPSCLLVTGLSGSGKSTVLKAILGVYPQVVVHHDITPGIERQHQVVWLKVDCPHDAGLRGLCLAIWEAIDRLLGTNYLREWSSTRPSIEELLKGVSQLINNLNLGVLVLDELQHLGAAKAGGQEKMLNFFVTLINNVGIPLIFAGTYTLEKIVSDQLRNARRATGTGTVIIPRLARNDPMWSAFVRKLWKYQWVMNPVPLTSEIEDVLYHCTQGIRDCIVKLFGSAQKLALEKGSETVSAETLREAFDTSFKPMHEALGLLRGGRDDHDPIFDDLLKNDQRGVPQTRWTPQEVSERGSKPNRRRTRSIDPAKCDRPSELPPLSTHTYVGDVDLRDARKDGYDYLIANGMIETIGSKQSVLYPAG
jgi:energy-coupling factor transporter ATP-binding protein EcfA2